ncbi:hypothetical protein LTS18_014873 [Coniosporium uncinatum]|uniref:Uncharacterized protein n=1 Tax=Coniosporium uncinatum TaxID=93489 RepID=A0ACC3DC38_9PEZI|nr:hypothetical protein LTS18_014873 [Coniosporium uncinatum]
MPSMATEQARRTKRTVSGAEKSYPYEMTKEEVQNRLEQCEPSVLDAEIDTICGGFTGRTEDYHIRIAEIVDEIFTKYKEWTEGDDRIEVRAQLLSQAAEGRKIQTRRKRAKEVVAERWGQDCMPDLERLRQSDHLWKSIQGCCKLYPMWEDAKEWLDECVQKRRCKHGRGNFRSTEYIPRDFENATKEAKESLAVGLAISNDCSRDISDLHNAEHDELARSSEVIEINMSRADLTDDAVGSRITQHLDGDISNQTTAGASAPGSTVSHCALEEIARQGSGVVGTETQSLSSLSSVIHLRRLACRRSGSAPSTTCKTPSQPRTCTKSSRLDRSGHPSRPKDHRHPYSGSLKKPYTVTAATVVLPKRPRATVQTAGNHDSDVNKVPIGTSRRRTTTTGLLDGLKQKYDPLIGDLLKEMQGCLAAIKSSNRRLKDTQWERNLRVALKMLEKSEWAEIGTVDASRRNSLDAADVWYFTVEELERILQDGRRLDKPFVIIGAESGRASTAINDFLDRLEDRFGNGGLDVQDQKNGLAVRMATVEVCDVSSTKRWGF